MKKILFLTVISISLFSCKKETSELITGRWEHAKITNEDGSYKYGTLGYTYVFNEPDGWVEYIPYQSETEWKTVYTLKGDSLFFTTSGSYEKKYHIKSISKDELILTGIFNGTILNDHYNRN